MSWYRTHRPKQVAALHLSDVKELLLSWMKKGHIPQVLLFTGPKGTGKTSSARIIGALLNDSRNAEMVDHQFFGKKMPKDMKYEEPTVDDEFNQKIFAGQSFVVQEMDAASNRGIDDVRALKERVALPPQQGKMTVYILDEVHMLTTEAFNALLKVLEEPPAHVVFILATTELHKVPDTIVSRSSVVQFRKATSDELAAAMEDVLKEEKHTFDPAALSLVAQKADGSFRDAVKLLEMVAQNGEITTENAEKVLHSSVDEVIQQLIQSLLSKDELTAGTIFQELRKNNVDEGFFFKVLLDTIHRDLLRSIQVELGQPTISKPIALFLLKELSQIPQAPAPIPFLLLELKILELIGRSNSKSSPSPSGTPDGSNNKPVEGKKIAEKPIEKNEALPVIAEQSKSVQKGDSQQLIAKWPELLAAVKQKNMTIEALLRSAKPIDGINGTAKVAVYYKFHKEQLEHSRIRSIIEECVVPLAGGPVTLEYTLLDVPAEAELVEDVVEVNTLVSLAEEALI